MPLPFSFSTQRAPTGPVPVPVSGAASLENPEIPITPGAGAGVVLAFAPPTPPSPVFTPASMTPAALPRPVTAPQAAFPNTMEIKAASHAPTTHLSGGLPQFSQPPDAEMPAHEMAVQIDQLRNDLFAAATNISALNDRLERLENRPATPAGQQAEIASLRADIERWICHHLEAAVEQSMRRIWERSLAVPSAATSRV